VIRLVNEEKHGRLGANTSAARRGNRGSTSLAASCALTPNT
jgi:hypothetical protein